MEVILLSLGSRHCLILLKHSSKGFKIHQLRRRKTEGLELLFLLGNKRPKKRKLHLGVVKEESVELFAEFSMEVAVEQAVEETVVEGLAVEVEDAREDVEEVVEEVVEAVEKLI